MKFSEWLAGYGSGALDDELTAALEEIAEQVVLNDKTGGLTLKLTLGEKGGGVIVAANVTAAPPKTKREQFFYVDPDGGLASRDPRQPQLPGTESARQEARP
jgi:hypothetical protein